MEKKKTGGFKSFAWILAFIFAILLVFYITDNSGMGKEIAIYGEENSFMTMVDEGQVKEIYTGKITNWKELGGADAPIVVISREEGSGTRDAFQEIVGYKSEELIKDASIADGSGAVKTAVAGNENAIGFASFEYVDSSVAALKVNGVEAEADNVKAGQYQLSRPFLLVTKKDSLTEAGTALIDYVLSKEGQEIVKENKLITLE